MQCIHGDTYANLPDAIMSPPALASREPGSGLRGRRSECEALDQLVASVRAGQSRVLVLRGEAGVGKTVLLEYLLGRASGCRVAQAAGAQSEMELAFAGLHQLCAPFLGRLERLPIPQRDALSTAFSLRDGDPPDRFAVGLAVLGLLSDAARERPLVCVVDRVRGQGWSPDVAPGRRLVPRAGGRCWRGWRRDRGFQAASGPRTVMTAAALRVVMSRPAAGNACLALVLRSRCRSRSMVKRRLPRSRRVSW